MQTDIEGFESYNADIASLLDNSLDFDDDRERISQSLHLLENAINDSQLTKKYTLAKRYDMCRKLESFMTEHIKDDCFDKAISRCEKIKYKYSKKLVELSPDEKNNDSENPNLLRRYFSKNGDLRKD